MKIEVLVSAMHQTDHELLKSMKIQSDAVIVNQCDADSLERFSYNNHNITWINTSQRGLSKSRNMAMSYATADVCLIADEDEILEDNYPKIIEKAFDDAPRADIISFNFIRSNFPEQTKKNKCRKAPRFRYYSSVSLAFKMIKTRKYGLHFNELIGAGSEYCAGEETVFEQECRKNGLKIYENDNYICSVDSSNSTWFRGFDEKYFFNLGVILAIRHRSFAPIFMFYYVYRFRKHKDINKKNMIKSILAGISRFENL